jgi:Helix-turn-helix domain
MEGARFDFRSLGKPDYARCHAIIGSLPPETRKKLSSVSTELLVRVLHLSWTFAYRSGRGSGYCWPTLVTLGKYCSRSVRTVQRHLHILVDSGLLRSKTRRTATNGFTSNLYIIGNRLGAVLYARRSRKVEQNHRTPKVAHNDLKREYKSGESDEDAAFWERMRQKKRQLLDDFLTGKSPTLA